jgi:hypothetical protein
VCAVVVVGSVVYVCELLLFVVCVCSVCVAGVVGVCVSCCLPKKRMPYGAAVSSPLRMQEVPVSIPDSELAHFCYLSASKLYRLCVHYFGMPTHFSSVQMVLVCYKRMALNQCRTLSQSDSTFLDAL